MKSDVSFIQWYYQLAADFPETPEARKAIYRKVQVTGSCLGTDSDPLVAAIMAQQKALNHPFIDGRVDVATGSGSLGSKAFMVFRIVARLATMFPNAWPRLDQIPRCPALVKQAVLNSIPLLPPG